MKKVLFTPLILAAALVSTGLAAAEKAKNAAPVPVEMQQMMKTYTPELRQKVMALSPELKSTIQKLHAGHTRRAKETNLRQIMHEILSDYQSIASALASDNAEQASEAARRLANHRIPKGGLLAYFPLDKVNNNDLGVLPAMNDIVEGSALKLADAADAGDMPKAASYMSDIMTGCVACHQKFRGTPGISAHLITPPSK
jgi:Spy/CpxP family protein refolding chaperone